MEQKLIPDPVLFPGKTGRAMKTALHRSYIFAWNHNPTTNTVLLNAVPSVGSFALVTVKTLEYDLHQFLRNQPVQ